MDLSLMHFAHPLWLWALLFIPLLWALLYFFYREDEPIYQLEKFIDKHLIRHLLIGGKDKEKKRWRRLLFWSFAWSCLTLALSGPRWDFSEIETFNRDQHLVILLDLSTSMNASDVAPTRLGLAKQKIEDLLSMSTGTKVGLIGFAADPHMIVPLTEDKETIRNLLPSLDSDLVYIQGSKLKPALEMAATMIENEAGSNQAIVVISDGGFDDADALQTAKRLARTGIVIHTIGVGTKTGAPLKTPQGIPIKKNGSLIMSTLEKEKFREVSKVGNGRYFDADHSDQIAVILEDLASRGKSQRNTNKMERFWKEHFYLFLLPVLPFFLFWYRRGYIFAVLLFSLAPSSSQAAVKSFFYNSEQKGSLAYENEDYETANDHFQDPYRKGVALYRMGDYERAEELFRESKRPEVASSAGYNLSNALVQQNKLQEAVTAYENVLDKWPEHEQARENLELVKKMLEEQENSGEGSDKQEKQEDSKDESSSEDPNEENESEERDGESQGEENQDEEDSEDSDEKELPETPEEEEEQKPPRSQEDLDADLWLSQIKNDPKTFLKNKFYIESKKNGTKEDVNPW